jgi:hypothetical protein
MLVMDRSQSLVEDASGLRVEHLSGDIRVHGGGRVGLAELVRDLASRLVITRNLRSRLTGQEGTGDPGVIDWCLQQRQLMLPVRRSRTSGSLS